MKNTKIILISGFLGSGKTTFIKKILNEYEDTSSLVIIENEFGEVSIDSAILSETEISIREINAGCICCSVAGDFNTALKEIQKEYNPNTIIIEPSGVAKLSEVKESILENKGYEIEQAITVIDMERFEIYAQNFGDFYKNQIKHADTIVLSRFNQKMTKVITEIEKINPKANVINKEWDKIKIKDVLKTKTCSEKKEITKNEEENFQSITFVAKKKFEKENLEKLLKEFNTEKYGKIIRAKGFVKTTKNYLQFDYVPNEINIYEKDRIQIENTFVVVIGQELKEKEIEKNFQPFLKLSIFR